MRLFEQIFVLAIMAIVTPAAMGQGKMSPLSPGALVVILDESSAKGVLDVDEFETFCADFGSLLSIDQGVFGLGIFTEVKCRPDMPASAENLIRMRVVFDGPEVQLTLELATLGNPKRQLAGVTFKHGGKFSEMLENPAFSTLTALALLEQLPYQMVLQTGTNKENKHVLSDAEKSLIEEGVRLPESLHAFRATVDASGLIYPNSVGTISMEMNEGKAAYLHEDAAKKGGEIFWKLSAKTKKLPAYVLGINIEGRSASKGKLENMIAEKSELLISDINRNLLTKSANSVTSFVGKLGASGYLGLRYGPALLPGDLIDQSKYFGALVEFRSGPLDGLRMYYDYWPEVKGTINGQSGTFGGKRAIVAYSFALKFDSWVRKIDLTPKIGVWTFRSKAPIELEPGVYVSPEFEVKKAPSFDIEVGVETASSVHILRGWASRGASVLARKGADITSTRVGMDLLLSPWGATKPVTVSLLSFYFFEAVDLRKSQEVEGEQAELDQLSYSQAYAGAGLAVSW